MLALVPLSPLDTKRALCAAWPAPFWKPKASWVPGYDVEHCLNTAMYPSFPIPSSLPSPLLTPPTLEGFLTPRRTKTIFLVLPTSPMAITRFSSARSSSPTPSENSDMYYEDFDHTSPSPVPSQTMDALGWESDDTPVPTDPRDVTPTPQAARASSPTSVVEISPEDFPMLQAPAPATVTKPHAAKAAKAKKGKEKAKATGTAAPDAATRTSDADDPLLAEDIARATAASLGLTMSLDDVTAGTSSSRHPAMVPGSPYKRQHANTAGDVAPAPFAPVAATTAGTSPFLTPVGAAAPAVAAAAGTPVTLPALETPVAAVATPTAIPASVAITTPSFAQAVAQPPVITTQPPAITMQPPAVAAQPPAAAAPPFAAAIAGAAPLPPLWLTADGLPPGGSFTPTPLGRFPDLVYLPEALHHGVPAALEEMNDAVGQPKFYLVASGGNNNVLWMHGVIRDTVGNCLNIDPTDFTLGTLPTAANGAPQRVRHIVLRHHPFFALPYDMPIVGFVGIFSGFTLPNSNDGALVAQDLLRTAIAHNDKISQFVQLHRLAYGNHISDQEVWLVFLASIHIESLVLLVNDTNTVSWHLYVNPPTRDRDEWGQLRRLFGRLQVMTARYGTARLQHPFCCRICPGIDHPTLLCPFPSVPGWLGLTPATIAALEDAGHAAAARAQELMHTNDFDAGPSSSRAGNGCGCGANSRARGNGRGKRGRDPKGKGKRREHDDFF
ncbi:hypothetical protein B0H10DRAFT_2208040 [Mycena sp. CBHHK59/15]|nr:hypothetical protein B0H10DRAFT_2208040 [Mycena sp. CBHHK59/15]